MRLLVCLWLVLTPAMGWGSNWGPQDTVLEVLYEGLTVMDWAQTRHIHAHKDIIETNFLLGKHPGKGRINTYFISSLIAHPFISSLLPSKARALWQGVFVGIELVDVSHNYQLGLKVKF